MSHEEREAVKVFQYSKGTTRATNGLVEVIYDLNSDLEVFGSVAKKTRLPTLKDRYSARMGRALPNPDLKPEVARHAEIGMRGTPWTDAYAEVTLFYSGIRDEVQTVKVEEMCGKNRCDQAQNVGKTRHRGLELALNQNVGDQWRIGGAYTYLTRDNLSDRQVKLIDTPTHKLFAHATYIPVERLELQTTLNAETGRKIRYSQTKDDPESYPTLPGFTTLGFKATYFVLPELTLAAGVRNLNNKNYELADGYPMPGRTWFTDAVYRF